MIVVRKSIPETSLVCGQHRDMVRKAPLFPIPSDYRRQTPPDRLKPEAIVGVIVRMRFGDSGELSG